MRVVIIGGSGHVGTYLVPRLVEAGLEVVAVSRGRSEPYQPCPRYAVAVQRLKIHPRVDVGERAIQGDAHLQPHRNRHAAREGARLGNQPLVAARRARAAQEQRGARDRRAADMRFRQGLPPQFGPAAIVRLFQAT